MTSRLWCYQRIARTSTILLIYKFTCILKSIADRNKRERCYQLTQCFFIYGNITEHRSLSEPQTGICYSVPVSCGRFQAKRRSIEWSQAIQRWRPHSIGKCTKSPKSCICLPSRAQSFFFSCGSFAPTCPIFGELSFEKANVCKSHVKSKQSVQDILWLLK